MIELYNKIEELRNLPPNWCYGDVTAPNDIAIALAKEALRVCIDNGLLPKIVPSADEGVGFSFRIDGKFAGVEFYNTGEIVSVHQTNDEWEIIEEVTAKEAILEIKKFLND